MATAPTSLSSESGVDLDNCATEPIHIPGSIQPRGILLVVAEPDLSVVSASANIENMLGTSAGQILGLSLSEVLGAEASKAIARASSSFGDLRERNPVEITISIRGDRIGFDAILHRMAQGLLVELEVATGPRPFSFPNTYLAVRGAIAELNQALDLDDLYGIAARAIRGLTGFDRVMVYRYDQEFNGEVVAEEKREDLESFLGLHYPASDIPIQARLLYEKNWIRLISDVDCQPSLLISSGTYAEDPLDLTYATLRSVSPIHIEYLQNMGVRASMSVSLLRHGKLWGLIACHHYSGSHTPPYAVRTAAEFLGSTLSLRLVNREESDELRTALHGQSVLADISAGIFDESRSVMSSLFLTPGLLDLVPADGVIVCMDGQVESGGRALGSETTAAVARWAASGDEIMVTDCLEVGGPVFGASLDEVCGVIALSLPAGQSIVWFRGEAQMTVDWGGDPHQKRTESPSVRLSPRKSFERWKEVVRGRSQPWTSVQVESATALRTKLVEALYVRTGRELRLAETLQRSLLPTYLPEVTGWSISAHYEPTVIGKIGGDWYDVIALDSGEVALVVGDVAGHGLTTAGTMAQLRNALRAYLLLGRSPAAALQALNEFALHLLPSVFATAFVARLNPMTGRVVASSSGHLMPLVVTPGQRSEFVAFEVSPPIGVIESVFTLSEFEVSPGSGLVLFSDGLVERRSGDLMAALSRLGTLGKHLNFGLSASSVFERSRLPDGEDDSTVIAAWRNKALE